MRAYSTSAARAFSSASFCSSIAFEYLSETVFTNALRCHIMSLNKEAIDLETKAKKSLIQVRMDETVKTEAVAVLNSLGMDTSTAINIFFRQVIAENGLPFQPKKATFNNETLAAIKESDEKVKNRTGKRYTSVDDLFEDALGD